MKDKVIESGKPKRVSKSPWGCRIRKGRGMPKESKWPKDAQEEINGTQEPASHVVKNPNDHTKSLREE